MQDFSHTNPLVPPEDVSTWLEGSSKPIAITGGTGFVGSHLVDTLCAAGIEPRVLVRDPEAPRWIADAPVRWVVGALNDQQALRRLVKGAGTVFHLAGVLRAGRESDFDSGNRVGTANVVTAMREVGSPRGWFTCHLWLRQGRRRRRTGSAPRTNQSRSPGTDGRSWLQKGRPGSGTMVAAGSSFVRLPFTARVTPMSLSSFGWPIEVLLLFRVVNAG